jgi:hypothetical protein
VECLGLGAAARGVISANVVRSLPSFRFLRASGSTPEHSYDALNHEEMKTANLGVAGISRRSHCQLRGVSSLC